MRGFGAFWTARTVSRLGSAFSMFAVPVYLYDVGASAVVIGLVLAARAVPVLLAPLAGVFTDRADPRRVMIACDIGMFLATGAIAVLLPPPSVLVALLVVSSLFGTVFLPAGKTAVPRLVPRERIGRANALLGISTNVAVAVGPLLGAVVYELAGARAVVLVVLAYGLAGAGNGLENIGTDTAIGEQVPVELLGRVFGAIYAPLALADIIASAAAGPLLEATSARTVFLVAGVGSVAAAVMVAVLARRG